MKVYGNVCYAENGFVLLLTNQKKIGFLAVCRFGFFWFKCWLVVKKSFRDGTHIDRRAEPKVKKHPRRLWINLHLIIIRCNIETFLSLSIDNVFLFVLFLNWCFRKTKNWTSSVCPTDVLINSHNFEATIKSTHRHTYTRPQSASVPLCAPNVSSICIHIYRKYPKIKIHKFGPLFIWFCS